MCVYCLMRNLCFILCRRLDNISSSTISLISTSFYYVQEMFNKASTHYFGSICYGSLYFGIFQIIQGLSSFFSYHNVPVLPSIFEWFLSKISVANEWAFVYVGLYGYSYKSAGSNVSTMFRNKGLADQAQNKLAGNILLLSSLAVGLLSGFTGLIFSTFDYGGMWRSGLFNPTAEGFM